MCRARFEPGARILAATLVGWRQLRRAVLVALAAAGSLLVFQEVAGATHATAPPTAGLVLCVDGQVVTAPGNFSICPVNATRHVVAHQDSLAKAFQRIDALEHRVAQLEALLAGVTRSGTTLTFSGMNVQVVNGTGSTATANGLGNLVVGYNEPRFDGPSARSGSHNLAVGREHNFTSWGGIVVGRSNTISGPYSSVSGGSDNTASDVWSSVSGGRFNRASGSSSSVSGGYANTASGYWSSVSGGKGRSADGLYHWRAGSLHQAN